MLLAAEKIANYYFPDRVLHGSFFDRLFEWQGGSKVRQYECMCRVCEGKHQIAFRGEPYPDLEDVFLRDCPFCKEKTKHTRVLTRRAAAELRRKQQEEDLRASIAEQCAAHGFQCRFLYQSVIVTTELADWCFDYHQPRITLYHESTVKRNFETGNFAKAHVQFSARKISPSDVIDYIAAHDAWRSEKLKSDKAVEFRCEF